MRSIIVADIHSNLEALKAVLDDADRGDSFDQIWCLGDMVGYGPDPGACIDLLRQNDLLCVVGNHDQAAIGKISADQFNPNASVAVLWTRTQLRVDQINFLYDLPEVNQWEEFTLVHGSLRDPTREYLVSQLAAQATFGLMESSYCLVGHSHIPFLCLQRNALVEFRPFIENQNMVLGQDRVIVNPGGVGQPRDGDPRPSYAVYDSKRNTLMRRRVNYDVELTQDKMRRANLPEHLVQRLSYGK